MSSGNDRLETTMVVFPAVCGGIFILLLMSFCKKCGFTNTYDINANKYFQYVLYVCIKFYLMRSDEIHVTQLMLIISTMPHDLEMF